MPGQSSSSASDRVPTSVALDAFEEVVGAEDSEATEEAKVPLPG